MKFYEQLNPLQKEAVDTIDGPVLVLAGPGTGKTQLLSVRAASILRKTTINPENILILTYTNPAAKAMKERLAAVIGHAGYNVEVGTFHSFANSLIQDSAEAANYTGDRILMDEVERVKAIQYILDTADGIEQIRPFRAPYTYLRDILKKISDLKKDDVTPADLENYLKLPDARYRFMEDKHIKRLESLAIVYKKYEELKTGSIKTIFDDRGRYDFDDMIMFAVQAIRKESALKKDCLDRFKYIMVDEYQDTNGSQLDLLFELAPGPNANICCVGDDDQSIYRFQGATINNFKRLKEKYPELRTISLTDNYRSTDNLIAASRKIIETIPLGDRVKSKILISLGKHKNKEISYKELTTEEEELVYIIDKVRELAKQIAKDPALSDADRKHPYNNIAVLVRKRDQILKVIDAFLRAGVPYATDGKEDIAGEVRVRQLIDVLELAHIDLSDTTAKDSALYKVLTADYFSIPHVDILRFIHYANEEKKKPDGEATILASFMNYFGSEKNTIKFSAPHSLIHAFQVIKNLLDNAPTLSVHTLLLNFIKDAEIYEYILKEYADNGILKIRQLRGMSSFINMIKRSDLANPAIRLDGFLDEIETRKKHGLSIQGDLVTLTQEGVRVYTAHGSKGLEFHSVIMPFCLQNKSWPARPIPDKIPLPSDLFRNNGALPNKAAEKELALRDETRLFYVAMTRAKSNLVFTASPSEGQVSTPYLDNIGLAGIPATTLGDDESGIIGRSLAVTGLKDPFIGTEEVLKDMIAHLTLNPTRLNNYITCRRKFLYNDVLKLPGQKKKGLVFGNCVHKALEEIYKEFKTSRKFPSLNFFENAFRRELRFQGVDKLMERECLNKLKTLDGWFMSAARDPIIPLDLEQKLLVTISDNIIFTGKYDKVEWEDERRGIVRILDYKTGKPDEHIKQIERCSDLSSRECDGYLRQLVAYKLLYEKDAIKSKGRKVGGGILVFIEPVSEAIARQNIKKGQYVSKEIRVSDEMVNSLERIIIDSWNAIKSLRFEKLPEHDEDTCSKCDFETICWGRE